jgi:hypothetical protein
MGEWRIANGNQLLVFATPHSLLAVRYSLFIRFNKARGNTSK